MTNILWVTTDGSDMAHVHHKLLTERYMKTGMWIRCFKFTDTTSETVYKEASDAVDVIAFDETFPLHLLPKIVREDKDCIVAVRISLSAKNPTHDLIRWKTIERCDIALIDTF